MFEEDCILFGIGFNPRVLVRFDPRFDVEIYLELDYPFRLYIFGEHFRSASVFRLFAGLIGCGERFSSLNRRACLLALLLTGPHPVDESIGDVFIYLFPSLLLLLLTWSIVNFTHTTIPP